MSARTEEQDGTLQEQALTAFVARKAEIDRMLTRLQAFSNGHFGHAPEDVTWSHVGTLEHGADLLKRITDQDSKEGEHAS